jgi:hypothetical protein
LRVRCALESLHMGKAVPNAMISELFCVKDKVAAELNANS